MGWLATPDSLLFIRLGAAFNNISLNSNTTTYTEGTAVPETKLLNYTASKSLVGFRAGAGLEQKLTPRISVRADYVYTYYGKLSTYGSNYSSPLGPIINITQLTVQSQAVMGSIIYDFSVYRLFPDQVIFNDKKSCVIPYANPGEELFNHIEDMVNKFIESEKFFPKLILLKNHGIITCGKTIEECVVATEICEKSAEIFLSGVDKMNMTYLSNLDINKLINDENEKYRKSLI